MKGLYVLLAFCALTTAMVPRERRSVPEDLDAPASTPESTSTSSEKPKEICARQTPCGWAVYKPHFKIIEFNFNNTYCICGPGTECVQNEDDVSVSAYIYRCRLPSEVNEYDTDS